MGTLAYMGAMVTFRTETCDKCKNANPVSFTVKPEDAWKAVVLNRWRKLCPGCFDVEAEKARIRYSFANLEGVSWSDRAPPKQRSGRRR